MLQEVSEGSVCEGAQNEEAILLLPDPLQQFVDSRNSQRLGPQWTEAEVKLEATRHLAKEREDKHSQNKKTRYFLSIGHSKRLISEHQAHPCQQVFSFTAVVDGAEWSGWVVQAAVKVLVQSHKPVLLFLRLVHKGKLRTGGGKNGEEFNYFKFTFTSLRNLNWYVLH